MRENARRWLVQAGAPGALAALQLALAYGLRHHLYFNDDHEQIARAAFFSDLYVTQFSVHMPVPALVSTLYLNIVGLTHEANRSLAAVLGVVVLGSIWRLVGTFSGRWGRYGGFVAGLVWLSFVDDIWAFVNVSQLYSAAFLYAGLALAFTRDGDRRIVLTRPFAVGALFTLACLSRILVVEQIFVVCIATALSGLRPRTAWPAYLRGALGAALTTTTCVLAFFYDRLGELLYWTVGHNLRAKSGAGFNAGMWIGDLTSDLVRDVYLRITALLFITAVAYLLHRRKAGASPTYGFIWVAALVGGWLAANPSGIGGTFMQAIPAFPALAILVGVASSTIGTVTVTGVLLVLLSINAFGRVKTHVMESSARHQLAASHAIAEFIDAQTTSDDTMFVFGSDPLLYALAKRRSATMASIIYSEIASYEAEIQSQLAERAPKVVVFDVGALWFERDLRAFPRLARFILENYCGTASRSVLIRRTGDCAGTTLPALDGNQLALLDLRGADDTAFTATLPQPGLRFDTENHWSEVTVSLGQQASPRLVFRLESSNGFGGWFDDPSHHLRILTRDSDGTLSWHWFGAQDLVDANTVEVAYAQFRDGEPVDYAATIDELRVGGWGDRAKPVMIDRVSVVSRSIDVRGGGQQ